MKKPYRKYKLTETHKAIGTTDGNESGFQIEALVDIPDIGVKKGDLGGFIANEKCLSHEGNSWVFEGSFVALGSVVTENAQVIGNTRVSGNSNLRGNSTVEESLIQNASYIRGKSVIKDSTISNCLLTEDVQVHHSRLTQIEILSGVVRNSRLQSIAADKLVFEKYAYIEDCDMDFYDTEPCVTSLIDMKNVIATGLNVFQVTERTMLMNTFFLGESELRIGTSTSSEMNTCYLLGKEGELNVNSGKLTLVNSTIKGDITLTGMIQMDNSEMFGHTGISNKTSQSVSLVNSKVLECALIDKSDGTKESKFENDLITGDAHIEC